MIVLGFQYGDGSHDASAALVCDGELVAAAEEERFSRIKHDGAAPNHAIDYCLGHAGLTFGDIDCIAYPHKPYRSGVDAELADVDRDFLLRLHRDGRIRRRSLFHKRVLDGVLRAGFRYNWQMSSTVAAAFRDIRDRYGELPPICHFGHHESHAAAAFFTSGLDRAAITTVDGRGGFLATATWSACGDRLVRTAAEPYYNSLGAFYLLCTDYLGLGAFAEGKTMGLASYGDPAPFAERVSQMLELEPGDKWYMFRRPPSAEVLGFGPRTSEPILDGPYADFAAASQQALQRAIVRIAQSAITQAGSDALCLAGGVSLNCSANGLIATERVGESTWVFPAAGDAGLSVGAALLTAAKFGTRRQDRISHAYWGPSFTSDECLAAVRREPKVRGERSTEVTADVAALLAAGEVVGWFQGRMEMGPRALGNRSILADPRTVAMRDRVNGVKRRELWRPLAPVVLAERADEYFIMREPSPFMLFACEVRPEVRSRVPAVVHVDGSARPQTVTRGQNGRLHALLRAFEQLTSVPVLLNTSFNDAGEPIVCTPTDAIRTFLATGMDALVLEDVIVRRADAPSAA